MSDSAPAILGFGIIFLIVGGVGGAQLGLTATIIFLAASGVLLAVGGTLVLAGVRRRAVASGGARRRTLPAPGMSAGTATLPH
jgi:hypothetical protein